MWILHTEKKKKKRFKLKNKNGQIVGLQLFFKMTYLAIILTLQIKAISNSDYQTLNF